MEQNDEQQKGITLDELATMIKAGFDGVDEKMGSMQQEIGTLKKVMNNEFEKVNLRLDNVAHRFELVELQDHAEVLKVKTLQMAVAPFGTLPGKRLFQ